MAEVSDIGLKEEEEIELDLGLGLGLGLSLGGSKSKPKLVENQGGVESTRNGFDSDLREERLEEKENVSLDPQVKREIQALRRQEAKKKREEKQQKRGMSRGRNGECVEELEMAEQRVWKKEKTGHNVGSECEEKTGHNSPIPFTNCPVSETPLVQSRAPPVQYPYGSVQFLALGNGYGFPCVVPCWGQSVNEKNVVELGVASGGFRPFSGGQTARRNVANGYESGERDGGNKKAVSNVSSMCTSSVVSDHHSSSHEDGGSDSRSNSANSLPQSPTLRNSTEEDVKSHFGRSASSHPEEPAHGNGDGTNHFVKLKMTCMKPSTTRPKEEVKPESKQVPISKPVSTNENLSPHTSKEPRVADIGKPPKPQSNVPSLPQMPYVSTTGNGPNGKTVTGFLYRYTKSEVSIVCVCHGSTFSPAEFVQHAGGTDVSNPLRHITVIPSAFG